MANGPPRCRRITLHRSGPVARWRGARPDAVSLRDPGAIRMTNHKIAQSSRIGRENSTLVACAPLALLWLASFACHAAQAASVEAYLGRPFGVGRVTLSINSNGPVVPL